MGAKNNDSLAKRWVIVIFAHKGIDQFLVVYIVLYLGHTFQITFFQSA